MLLEPIQSTFFEAILQFCNGMKFSVIDMSTEFNSSSSGLPLLEVGCGAAQLLQM